MNSNEFVHWLKGYFDACEDNLSTTQLEKVKQKLGETYDVNCPQHTQPSLPYSPPWTIGDEPYNPHKIWYTTSTSGAPSIGETPNDYNN